MASNKWWQLKGDDCAKAVNAVVKQLEPTHSARASMWQTHASLYGVAPGTAPWVTSPDLRADDQVLSFNHAANFLDAWISAIVRNRPAPMIYTDGGTYSQQKQAEKATQWCEGLLSETRFYSHLFHRWVQHAGLYGQGIIQVGEAFGKVTHETVQPWELLVDDREALGDEQPRNWYRVRTIDRHVASELYGEGRAIDDAISSTVDGSSYLETGWESERIKVIEAYHLPSGPDAGDGRFVVCTDAGMLDDQPWDDEESPFVFLYAKRPPVGIWGIGPFAQMVPAQREHNFVTARLQHAINLSTWTKILHNSGDQMTPEVFDNDQMTLIPWSVSPPSLLQGQAVTPEFTNYRERLVSEMGQATGISQMSASAQKPSGVTAGVALQTLDNIESQRHMTTHQNVENAIVELTEKSLRRAKAIAEESGGYEVRYQAGTNVEKIDLSTFDIDELGYVIRCAPVSKFAKDPAARIDQLRTMVNDGLLSVDEFWEYADMPDTRQKVAFEVSPRDLVRMAIDAIVLEGKPQTATDFDPLDLIIELGSKAQTYYRVKGEPFDRIEMIIDYVVSAQQKKQALMAQQQAQQQPQQPPAQAMPAQPPSEGMQ